MGAGWYRGLNLAADGCSQVQPPVPLHATLHNTIRDESTQYELNFRDQLPLIMFALKDNKDQQYNSRM